MAEYLIQDETLTAITDAVRINLEQSKYTLHPQAIASYEDKTLVQGVGTIYYYEFIDDDCYAWYEEGRADIFVAYDYLPNNEGIIVPVLYKADPEVTDETSEYYGADFGDPCFYEGTVVIDGQSYDKWRKIASGGDFSWDGQGRIYSYTNTMVNFDGIPPTDLPNLIYSACDRATDKGYDIGYSDGTSFSNDATATADKILEGYTAYVNGEKIEGSIDVAHGGIEATVTPKSIPNTGIRFSYTPTSPVYLTQSTGGVYLTAPFSEFGNATAEDVASGKTFTSGDGLKVTGASTAVETNDATATADKILEGYTAYINGEKVEGSMPICEDVNVSNLTPKETNGSIVLTYDPHVLNSDKAGYVLPGTTAFHLFTPLTNFGDATAADVAVGKTFTSTAGLKVTGTASTSTCNLIAFNISGKNYVAAEGMTWIQWGASKANFDGYSVNSYGVFTADNGYYVVDASESSIYGSDVINDGDKYFWLSNDE